jgi:hypothetical protein
MHLKPDAPVFLLTCELAERWRLSVRTLERWRYVGVGPKYRKIGGRCVYAVAEIEQFEQSCDVERYR